jgi:hypothetical protein
MHDVYTRTEGVLASLLDTTITLFDAFVKIWSGHKLKYFTFLYQEQQISHTPPFIKKVYV